MKLHRLGLGLGTLILIAGCTAEVDVVDRTATTGHTIFGGSPPNAAHHDAVVSLHQLYRGGYVAVSPFCSGTLISQDVVLTAAHCLDTSTGPKPKFSTMKPSALAIYVGDEPAADILEHIYGVSETTIHPSFQRLSIRNDIALVRLSSPITEPIAPVPALPASLGFAAGDVGTLALNFAGFGQDENGNSGVKLQADGLLGGLGCTVNGCSDGGDGATQISYEQAASGPCFGDSGGPAFLDRDGQIYVGGVTSYGDSYCTIYGVSTRTDAFEAWIDGFVGGGTPPDPPDCSADGVCNADCAPGDDPDCGGNENCGNGVCDADESCDGRDGTSACETDCPGHQTGKPSGRYCTVGDTCVGDGCP